MPARPATGERRLPAPGHEEYSLMPKQGPAAEPDGQEGHTEPLPGPALNQGLELTAASVRSCVASAAGSSRLESVEKTVVHSIVMLALCCSSRQVVVADEQLDGPDMVGELLGKR